MSGNPPPQMSHSRTPRATDSRRPSPYTPVFAPAWGRVLPDPPSVTHLLFRA